MIPKKVSIILPTHNGDRYIREAIDSCLEQIYKNIELIVVDDGSSDNISKIITSYHDKRVRYLRHERNLGQARALNTGFSNASGEYLTWTSDDNIYSPQAIGSMVEALEKNKKTDYVYANYHEIDETGKILQSVSVGPPGSLRRVNRLGLCFLYRKKVYERLGGYDPEAFLVEDYEYWLRIYYNRFRMQKLNEYLYYFRVHKDSLTGRHDAGEVEKQAQKVRDKYIPAALRYYQHGAKAFYGGDHQSAKRLLTRSFLSNPFNLNVLRLLTLLFLDPLIVTKIRDLKGKIPRGR